MKYLTREWYYGNKDICLDLEVDSNAEQLSEEYYKELYNAKLNAFLEEEKEVSEMDYEPETWEDIQIMDEEGNIMGQHKGLIHYTIGQRKGLGIPSATPIFVKELRPENNEVVLCKSESLFRRECTVANVNYMAEESLAEPVHAIGKVRYSHAGAPCMIYPQVDGTLRIVFDESQRAMTPGQAAVFYRDDYVLCGGTIEREAR